MAEISVCNSAGRDAVVSMDSVADPLRVRWLDPNGRTALNVRFIKSTIEHELPALLNSAGDAVSLGQQLIDGDPEIDMEWVGAFLQNTSRVLIDPQRRIAHAVEQFEIVRNPDGSQRDRRARSLPPPNVTPETPLRWSGKLIAKSEALRKFVFSSKVQLKHINGLTYDFLYAMARELEAKQSLMLVGAGPKSNQPLILRRGGSPYRGFLEGRTSGDRYCLLLHLSNLELKKPADA
jgi:hypothetical protein